VCGEEQACVPTPFDTERGPIEIPVCVTRRAAPALVLGPVATSSTGASAWLEFDVPAGVGGLVIVATADDGLRVGVSRLEAPDGSVLIELDDEAPDLNPMTPYIQTASVLVPSSEQVTAAAGTWRLWVSTFDPAVFGELIPQAGTVDTIEIIFERDTQLGGRLDLRLGLASAFGLTATTATTSAFVQDVLQQIDAMLLEPADLEWGALEIEILSPEHDRVEDGDETRSLCRSRTEPGPTART
jgi:hypothetical protein